MSIAGRLLMGWLADRVPRKYVMLLIYLLVAAAIPLLLIGSAGPGPMMYVFAVVFGLGLGGEYMIIPLMAGELFGVRVLGRVMGIVLTADGVAEATAPFLVGYFAIATAATTWRFSCWSARRSPGPWRSPCFRAADSEVRCPISRRSRIPSSKSRISNHGCRIQNPQTGPGKLGPYTH